MIIARAEDLELASVLQRQQAIIAVATGEVSAAALHADWLVMTPQARLTIDLTIDLESATPALSSLIGALIWRMGPRARGILLGGTTGMRGPEALARGIADAVVPEAIDALEWTRRWAASRSARALDVAAMLLRSRGGDPLERALFAWLFATGEPQEGLRAFLEKRSPRWGA